nr:MAG TPA: hypothetical protein [Caudoviricetes sp.]
MSKLKRENCNSLLLISGIKSPDLSCCVKI